MAWSLYLKVKFRAFGVTYRTQVLEISNEGVATKPSVPEMYKQVFDRWGFKVYVPTYWE